MVSSHLQNKDMAGFYAQIWKFCWLAAAFIIVAVYQTYLNPMLRIRWRRLEISVDSGGSGRLAWAV